MKSVSEFATESFPSASKKSSQTGVWISLYGLSGVWPTFIVNSIRFLAQPNSEVTLTKTVCEVFTITG